MTYENQPTVLISGRAARTGRAVAVAAALALIVAARVSPAQAQTYRVLHSFSGPDGLLPIAGLAADAVGNLYGTTWQGGSDGWGVAFKLDPTTGVETVLHNFSGQSDGGFPLGGAILDADGNLYGTAEYGGASGSGVVFKLDSAGDETVLFNFNGKAEGALPASGLVRDAKGDLYGTTSQGGNHDRGVAFKLSPDGRETLLHIFTGGSDGAFPYAGLTSDASGNLYGTTESGGAYNDGTVFRIDPAGNETVLYSFKGGPSDGASPNAPVVRDADGNIYGTAYSGGGQFCGVGGGCGAVFRLDASGQETGLHSFTRFFSPDGSKPKSGLWLGSDGKLYGTTEYGGASGLGVVFELDSSGQETVLHSFAGPDGKIPYGSLVGDSAGNLYGTTLVGGAHGYGVVFEITP